MHRREPANAVSRLSIDLAAVLPRLLPKAIEWAEQKSSEILAAGESLSGSGIELARRVGVANPEKIRICAFRSPPLPDDEELRGVALQVGLLGPDMIGLTLGYGILIREGHHTHRLVSHECRHVYQYETAGSISNFLPGYLLQIAEFGYYNAPYEKDARDHEIESI